MPSLQATLILEGLRGEDQRSTAPQTHLQRGTQVSETATERSLRATAEYRGPEQEQAERGGDVRPAQDLPLEDINPVNPHLFRENRWQEYFERLRREDPVHFNEIETAGRYWSVTKYDDIKTVSSDWKTFSSAHGNGTPTRTKRC